jgi:hypothetical protein
VTVPDEGDRARQAESEYPIVQLLRELIAAPRQVSDAERASIVAHIASAEFNRNGVTTEEQIRGLTYLGRTVEPWADSLFVHLVRRVLVQRQWAEGTTEAIYLADLREAVLHPAADVPLGLAGGLPTVQITAPLTVPEERRGPRAQPWIVVICAPNRDRLVSGYQVRQPRQFPGSRRL